MRGAALIAAGATVVVARRSFGQSGFGPLKADPDGILDLPQGFSYRVLQTRGDPMSDGNPAGLLPDGMACFEGADGNWVLMRNHETGRGRNALPEAFDEGAVGGVSRLVLDPATREVVSSNLVLTGTLRNCAGGPSPWGWLSCEEVEGEEGHGWVFLCDPEASGVQEARPIRSYGRFKHEAVAVDPRTHIAYLTEDVSDSAFYRFVPVDEDQPFVGALQALAVVGEPTADLREGRRVGDTFEVQWVPVPDARAQQMRTREQARLGGAAIIARGEGCWEQAGVIFFTSTSGGPTGQGQVFRLEPEGDGGVLTLVAQAEGEGELVNPDNLTVAPWGDLIVCEAPSARIAGFRRSGRNRRRCGCSRRFRPPDPRQES